MPFYEQGSLQHRLDSDRRVAGGRGSPHGPHPRLPRSTTCTSAASCTATSSRPTCSSPSPTSRCWPTSAWPGWSTASVPMHTTGANVVTWAYGPPEAFTGGAPTPAWDVYSLGATVYAMLTGAGAVRGRRGRQRLHGAEPHRQRRDPRPARPRGVPGRGRRRAPDDGQGAGRPARHRRQSSQRCSRPRCRRPLAPRRARPAAIDRVPRRARAPGRARAGDQRSLDPRAESRSCPPCLRLRLAPSGGAGADRRVRSRAGDGRNPCRSLPPSIAYAGTRARAERPQSPRRGRRVPRACAVGVSAGGTSSPGSVGWLRSSFNYDRHAPSRSSPTTATLLEGGPGPGPRRLGRDDRRSSSASRSCTWRPGVGPRMADRRRRGLSSFFDLGLNFVFLDEAGGPYNETFHALRVVAAVLGAAVVALSWRPARCPGPRIGVVLGVILVGGAVMTFVGTDRFSGRTGYGGLQWMVLLLLALLLVRAFAYRGQDDRRAGARRGRDRRCDRRARRSRLVQRRLGAGADPSAPWFSASRSSPSPASSAGGEHAPVPAVDAHQPLG